MLTQPCAQIISSIVFISILHSHLEIQTTGTHFSPLNVASGSTDLPSMWHFVQSFWGVEVECSTALFSTCGQIRKRLPNFISLQFPHLLTNLVKNCHKKQVRVATQCSEQFSDVMSVDYTESAITEANSLCGQPSAIALIDRDCLATLFLLEGFYKQSQKDGSVRIVLVVHVGIWVWISRVLVKAECINVLQ